VAVDLATLALKVDSTEVKTGVSELDRLTAAGDKTTRSANQLAAAEKAAALQMERASQGLVKASSEAGRLRLAQTGVASSATAMAKEAQEAASRAVGLGNSSKLAGHHLQNLAFQANDLFVGLASGQKPMTVFMQQGTQIAQIMMQAGVGVRGMVSQLASMAGGFLLAHPLILAASAAIGVLALGLGVVTEEINKTSKVTVTWQDVMLGAFDVVSNAISTKVTAAFEAMGVDIGAVWESVKTYTKGAINFMIGASLAVPKTIAATYDKIPAAFGDAFYSAANLAIDALNKLAQMSVAPLNFIISGLNMAFGTTIPKMMVGGISAISNPYAGAMGALGSAGAKAFLGAMNTDYVAGLGEMWSDAAQNRSRLRQKAEAGGKSLGGAAGKAAGGAAAKAMADEWAKMMEGIIKEAMEAAARGSVDARARMNDFWDNSDAEALRAMNDKLDKAQQHLHDIAIENENAAAAQAYWNDQLKITVNYLDQLGGFGKTLGTIGAVVSGLSSGDFSGVGGKLGSVLGLINQTDSGQKFLRGFGDKLDKIFGGAGSFTKTISGALGTVGIGLGVADAVGNGSTGSKIGGAVGAAIGSILPGIGTVIGSIVGSIFGGLFSKAKTGSASVTQGGISIGGNNADARGNTGGIGGAVQSSIGKIIEALGGTAGSYGFSVGQRKDEYRVSGTAGADVTGKNPGNLLYRGKSAEEAARVALLNAINDGAVAGIREGAANLLKAGTDLEAQLNKALRFNAVFDGLAKELDPVAYATNTLTKEMDALRAIFTEAGASAADFAALEQLAALKQARIYNEAIRPQRELEAQILRLEGKELESTNMERALELAGLNATLRPLQERVYALTDEAIATQKAADAAAQAAAAQAAAAEEAATAQARLETERADLTLRLLELQDSGAAKAMRRMQELQAITDETSRALQQQIYVQEDINAARERLNGAYRRERGELTATADKFRAFADGLRGFRDTLYDNDNGLLSYAAASAKLRSVGALAGLGNEGALGALPGASRSFLDASKENAGSLLEYQRDVARVARYVDAGIAAASGAVSNAERQVAALDQSVAGLISINEDVVTVRTAIDELTALLVPPTAEIAAMQKEADKAAADFQLRLVEEVKAMRSESNATALRMIELTAKMEKFWTRAEVDGIKVRGDADDPVYTVAA
jgi:Prophage tail length tape measure protein